MHIPLGKRQPLTTYRKIAIASWRPPDDPSTYSWMDLPIDEAERFLKSYASSDASYGAKPTLTHYVAKIVADCLEKHPELNHLLRARNLYRRTQTGVFITTLLRTEKGSDLSGFALRDVPHRTLSELAILSNEAVERLRTGDDAETKRIDELTAALPIWIIRLILRVQFFFHYTLNISLRRFGMPDDRFGSVIISNFGVLGIDNALVPLSPYTRCPLIIGMGRPRPMPIVRDGQVVVATCVNISFTFDHRYADGTHGAQLMRRFQKIFLNPHRFPDVFASAIDKLVNSDTE